MNLRQCSIVGLVFINVMWQAVVWSRDIVYPAVAWPLIFLIPILLGVGLYWLLTRLGGKNWAWIFVMGSVIVPLLYLASVETRLPDFVRFNERPESFFSGSLTDLKDANADFYEIRGFSREKIKKDRFGVSYSMQSSKGGGSRYTDHFVLPVFDNTDISEPRLWVFKSFPSIYIPQRDSDEFVMDGLELKAFREQLGSDVIFGRKTEYSDTRNALSEYRAKFKMSDQEPSLIIELLDEKPQDYFCMAAAHFWLLTAGLNLMFLGLCFLAGLMHRGSE